MLRKLVLKNRDIPLPIPIQTLGDAIAWIEGSLLRKDAVLTSVLLEDKELINELYRKSIREQGLHESSSLEIKIETPKDLASQSLDVVCDLAYGIALRIKKMSLNSWHGLGRRSTSDLEEMHCDIQLLQDLIAHINDLSEQEPKQFLKINDLNTRIHAENLKFHSFILEEDWQEIAKILEQSMEPDFKELASEGEKLQIQILTSHL